MMISSIENECTIDCREGSVMKPVGTRSEDWRGEPWRGESSVNEKKNRGD